jgi:hypothetical protein
MEPDAYPFFHFHKIEKFMTLGDWRSASSSVEYSDKQSAFFLFQIPFINNQAVIYLAQFLLPKVLE